MQDGLMIVGNLDMGSSGRPVGRDRCNEGDWKRESRAHAGKS